MAKKQKLDDDAWAKAWMQHDVPLSDEQSRKLAGELLIDTQVGESAPRVNEVRVKKLVQLSGQSLERWGVSLVCESCKKTNEVPDWTYNGGPCDSCDGPMWFCLFCEKLNSDKGLGRHCNSCPEKHHEVCNPFCHGCHYLQGCCCNCDEYPELYGEDDEFDSDEEGLGW